MNKFILGKAEIIFTIFRYFTFALQILRGLLIANFLGPYYFGIFGYVILIQQYLMYSNLGIQQLLNAELSINFKNDYNISVKFIGIAFLLTTVINFILISIGVLSNFYNFHLFNSNFSINYFILILFLAALINYQQLFLNIFRVYNKLKIVVISEIVVVISTILPLFFFKNDELIFSYIISWIFSLICVLVFYYLTSPIRISMSLNLKESIYFLKNGFPYFLYNLSFVLIGMISRTIIATNFSIKEMGYYSFANNISTGVMLGFDTITWLIFPKIVSFFSQIDTLKTDLENKIVSISKKINLFIFTSVMVLIICLPFLFRVFPDYLNSGKSVSILLLTQAVLNSGFAMISLYVSRKKYIKLVLFSSIALVICYVSAKCFVYLDYSFEWIAFSTLIGSFSFINLLNYWGSIDFNLSYSKINSAFTHITQSCIFIASICILSSNFWIAILAFSSFVFFKKDDIITILYYIKYKKYIS